MVRIGLMGGTFDPVHLGHLILAEEARVRLGLEEVLFIPTGQPWLKVSRAITAASHRLAMVELAIQDNPYFRVSSLEIERPGPTYSVDTLTILRQEMGSSAMFYFLLGYDSLRDFHRWKDPERILELCILVGLPRPGFPRFDPLSLEAMRRGAAERVILLNGPCIGISGTDIRERVAREMSIRYLVPPAVEDYIRRHQLYKAGAVYEGRKS